MSLGNAEEMHARVGPVRAEIHWITSSLGVDKESLGMEATTVRALTGSEVSWDGPPKLTEDSLEVVGAGLA